MRRIAFGVVILLSGVAILIATALVFRVDLLTAGIRYGVARAGLPEARFQVERVTFHDLAVTAIDAGPAFRGDHVEITFDLARLPDNPVERVRITGARVDLSAVSARSGDSDAAPGGMSLGWLPILELRDVRVTVPSPYGPAALRLDSEVAPEGDDLRMHLDGIIEHDRGAATVAIDARRGAAGAVSVKLHLASIRVQDPRLRIASGSVSIGLDAETSGFEVRRATGELETDLAGVVVGDRRLGTVVATAPVSLVRARDGDGPWTARLSNAALRIPAQGLEASTISGEMSAETIHLRIGQLTDTGAPRRFEPVSFRVKILETTPEVVFAVDLTAAKGRVPLHATGRYDPARGQSTLDVTLPRLEIDPEGLRLTDVSPRLGATGLGSGTIEGTASLRWQPTTGFAGAMTLGLDGTSIEASGVRLDDLTGTVALRRLFPPETAGPQTLRARTIRAGVVLSDATLRWALERRPGADGASLRIERFDVAFAGGKILVEDALLEPSAAANELRFRFEEVDVAELLAVASLEGVTGSGRLSGTIPVSVRERAVAIPEGRLAAGRGVLRVRSKAARDLLASGGESTALLLDALRDFHYDNLNMIVNKNLEGETVIQLRLEGRNPEVLEGHPFRINLNLSGNLDRLVGSLLELARISDQAVRATLRAVE